jgi:hypothetical protein
MPGRGCGCAERDAIVEASGRCPVQPARSSMFRTLHSKLLFVIERKPPPAR